VWPLLTVETESKGDLWGKNERGPSMGSSGAKDFYPALAALVRPVKKFVTVNFFTLCFPIAQLPDQAVVLGRLSLYMCLWSCPFLKGQPARPFHMSVH
jgi:hypothetical protein